MPWRKVHTLITIFLGTTIPSQFGLINLQISCQIVSKMIGVIRFREGYYVVPLSFKGNQKTLQFNVSIFFDQILL